MNNKSLFKRRDFLKLLGAGAAASGISNPILSPLAFANDDVLDKKILVKITERTPTNKHETSVLLKKQNSITKISGAVVNTLKKIYISVSLIKYTYIKKAKNGYHLWTDVL